MNNKGKIIILGVVGFIILFIVLGFLNIVPIFKSEGGDPNYPSGEIELNFWGVDDRAVFSEIIKSYGKIHKNVKINYTQFSSLSEYEKSLVKKLAEGAGPDLFMVPSYWVEKYKEIMFPAYSNLISSNWFLSSYPDVVSKDFIRDGYVYASPLYMDALVLIYNKDIFNAKAVVFPPKDWEDFADTVVKTREMSNRGKIIQAGAAMGSAKNVPEMADILSSIMLQLGSRINDGDSHFVKFDENVLNAVKFYVQFANPISTYYTWNDSQPNAEDAFAAGDVAMIIDYRDAVERIKEKNPFIRVGVSQLPQSNIYRPKSFANYMGLAVAKRAGRAKAYAAWDFIRFITTDASVNNMYLEKTGRLPALRTEIQKLINTENDTFARSFLSADSWRRADWVEIKNIFSGMIEDILSGRATERNALKAAEERINDLVKIY